MSLVNEYEAAKIRNEKLQRIAKTLTDALECFQSAVQELHDVVVDTFIARLDGRTDDTAKSWMDGFQESLEQTEIYLDDFCKGLKNHLALPSELTNPPSDAGHIAEKEMVNPVVPLSLRSLHAMAKYLDGHYAGMANCAAGIANCLANCMASARDNEKRKADLLNHMPKAFTASCEDSTKFLRLLPSVVLPGPSVTPCQAPIPRPRNCVPERTRVRSSRSGDLVSLRDPGAL